MDVKLHKLNVMHEGTPINFPEEEACVLKMIHSPENYVASPVALIQMKANNSNKSRGVVAYSSGKYDTFDEFGYTKGQQTCLKVGFKFGEITHPSPTQMVLYLFIFLLMVAFFIVFGEISNRVG